MDIISGPNGEGVDVRDDWLPSHLTRLLRESLNQGSISTVEAEDYLGHLLQRTSGYAGSSKCERRRDTWTTHWALNAKLCAEEVEEQLLKDIELIRQVKQRVCESLESQA